ncbi:MAG: glycosyltransferase family 32 protein [Janthinobacterium lividum]
MIPRIFHLTAPSKTLSWEERRIRARLVKLLPDWQNNLWDDQDNSALMARVFPQFAAQFEAIRFGVMKADIARLAYMHAYGGFYFDTDYKLLKPLDPGLLAAGCILPIEEGTPGSADFKLGNAVFGSAPGHPFWADFITSIFNNDAPEDLREHLPITNITGPSGLTRFYMKNRDRYSGITFPQRDAFHPSRTYAGLSHLGGDAAYGSHLCWASWRGKSFTRAVTNYCRRKITAPL